MMKRYLSFVAWLAVVGLRSVALAQPVGPEFQVNTYTTGLQLNPDLALDANGNFVVVWQGSPFHQDGNESGIFGQRYDSSGNALGGEFLVNTYTTFAQKDPSIASDANGNFIVVWASRDQEGSPGDGIFGQRYRRDGTPLGGEFHVNTYTDSSQSGPSVSSDPAGNFVVVWESFSQVGRQFNVFGQRYDSGGNALGGEFQVNTYTPNDQGSSSIASDANGNFVVVWSSTRGQDGSNYGIFGQRYDNNGNRLGDEFQVNTYTTSFQEAPSVASDATGNFVVVWTSLNQDGDRWGIFGQRYDSGGNVLGGEFQANTYTTLGQFLPSVASGSDGDFVVVWESGYFLAPGQDGDDQGVFGQRYDRNGTPVGGEFQVNTYTTKGQSGAMVAQAPGGDFVVVWRSNEQDGSSGGIFGQRFSAGCKASVQVQGDVNTAGTTVPVQVHIAHHRPKTVTVRWKLRLLDACGQVVAEHISPPHTFEPGDVLDQEVKFQLPDDLASGEYTLDLAVKQMAGTKGARTTLRIVRAE